MTSAVDSYFARLGQIRWRSGPIEDLVRERYAALAEEIVSKGSLIEWARGFGRRINEQADAESQALDLVLRRHQPSKHDSAVGDPLRRPTSWSVLVRDGRRMRAPSERLQALALLLDGTRTFTRRQRLAAACHVFADRPVAVAAQARFEGGWPLAVEAGFGATSTTGRSRYLRALKRVWDRDRKRRRVKEADLLDARGSEALPYVGALAEAGILGLGPDHPWMLTRFTAVLDRRLLERTAARLPEDARRVVLEERVITPKVLAQLSRNAPKRHSTLRAADAAIIVATVHWRAQPVGHEREPELSTNAMASLLERNFSQPWYAFLHAARESVIDDWPNSPAPEEAFLEHAARASSRVLAPRDRLGYLWWAVQTTDEPSERVHAAAQRLDLVQTWLSIVDEPTEVELEAVAAIARAYPVANGQSLHDWTLFVDAVLEAGAKQPVDGCNWPGSWTAKALDSIISDWPERRRQRFLSEVGRRAWPVRMLDLKEPRRSASPERFEAALTSSPAAVARLLVSDRGLRSIVRERIAAGDVRLRDEVLCVLPEAFEGETKLRVAVELALRSDLGLLPRLAPLLRFVMFDQQAEVAYGAQLRPLYVPFGLPKRRGGVRTVHAPIPWLKVAQRGLLEHLFARGPWPDAAHGFVAGRNVVSNAAPHARQQVVVNVDIARFFDSTPYERIKAACREALGPDASSHAVVALAEICSYDGALPTGAPTSPAIGNLVLRRVDRALTKAAARRGVAYTRYADDLTFSGSSEALQLVPFARRLLGELGYELDTRKTNIFRRGRRQVVTGLVVNERPTASRTYRRRLRAAIHTFASTGSATWHGRPVTRHQLMGHIGFLAETRPQEARRLRLSLSPAPAAES